MECTSTTAALWQQQAGRQDARSHADRRGPRTHGQHKRPVGLSKALDDSEHQVLHLLGLQHRQSGSHQFGWSLS